MSTSNLMTYVSGSTLMHRLDPRTKLTLLSVMVILPLLFTDLVYLIIMVLGLFLLTSFSRISFRTIFAFIKPVLPLVAFMVVIQGLWGDKPIYFLGPVAFYSSGLAYGSAMAMRMLTMVFATAIILITTNPTDLIIGMRSIGMPHKLAFMSLTAFRFIPTLMGKASLIQDAQKSRGMRTGDEAGNFIKKIIALIPVLVPLYVASLELAEKLALAMEARGFGASPRVTYARDLYMKVVDYVSIMLFGIILIFGVVVKIMGYGNEPLGTFNLFHFWGW